MNKLNNLCLLAKIKWNNFLHQENGDTNFLSIIIIMIIVISVAILFITFKNTVKNWFQVAISNLYNYVWE